jgi:hypothetical protein
VPAQSNSSPPNPAIAQLALDPAAATRVLGGIALLLIGAHIAGQLVCAYTGHYPTSGGIIRLFNLDLEANIPASYSMILLLVASAILGLITTLEKMRRAPGVAYWLLLAAGFLAMALDEACSLHEKLNKPFNVLLGSNARGIFYFSWVLPAAALVAGLALLFVGFLRRLPAPTGRAFSVAGIIYVGSAVGVEALAGRYAELNGYNNLTYAFIVVLEEGLEMTGVILFLRSLLDYLRAHHGEVSLRFGPKPPA